MTWAKRALKVKVLNILNCQRPFLPRLDPFYFWFLGLFPLWICLPSFCALQVSYFVGSCWYIVRFYFCRTWFCFRYILFCLFTGNFWHHSLGQCSWYFGDEWDSKIAWQSSSLEGWWDFHLNWVEADLLMFHDCFDDSDRVYSVLIGDILKWCVMFVIWMWTKHFRAHVYKIHSFYEFHHDIFKTNIQSFPFTSAHISQPTYILAINV